MLTGSIFLQMTEAWTPGFSMTKSITAKHVVWKWGWVNSTHSRTQDSFTCAANQVCYFLHINASSANNITLWQAKGKRSYQTVLFSSTDVMLSFLPQVSIKCCCVNLSTQYRFVQSVWNAALSCNQSELSFNVSFSQFILCTNGTPISGRIH